MGLEPPRRLEAALTKLDVPRDLKVYPDAGHSFMSTNPSWLTPLVRLVRLDYKPEAAEDCMAPDPRLLRRAPAKLVA